MPVLVHVTDLHLDDWPQNLGRMVELVQDVPADLYLIGGDNGNEEGVTRTITELARIRGEAHVAWVLGNHDLWQRPYTDLWRSWPKVPGTYLERENLETPYCTVVGTYGHYDYSGGDPEITFEQYEAFTDGRLIWNDRYIDRLGKTNPEIAKEIVQRFAERYAAAIDRGLPIVVLTHTWPFAPTDPARRSFVAAYCCNQLVGEVIQSFDALPAVLFCGHTHRATVREDFGFPMINTGSDYQEVRITEWTLPA